MIAVVRQGRHRRSEGRRRQGQAASRSISRPARSACTRRRPSSGDVVIVGSAFAEGADRRDAQQHQGPGARVRRADRQAAVAVQHDSAARRVRQRHVGERLLGRSTATSASGRRSPSTKSSASSTCRSRRRRRTSTAAIGRATTCSPRAWSRRSEDRPAQVALPVRASSDLELRHVVGADPGRHHRRRPARSRRWRCRASRRWLYVFDRVTGAAGVADRGAAGAAVATCPARRPRRRSRIRPSRRRTRATVLKVPDDLIDFTPELRAAGARSG